MKILLVDDDESFCAMLKDALEARGHAVQCRYDPVAGAAVLPAFRPELLLLDVDMPAGGGKIMYRRVRESPETANMPVIVVTGTTGPAQVWQKLDAVPHPRSYVHNKPVDLAVLMRWIDSLSAK